MKLTPMMRVKMRSSDVSFFQRLNLIQQQSPTYIKVVE
jgi:hypothetical protein